MCTLVIMVGLPLLYSVFAGQKPDASNMRMQMYAPIEQQLVISLVSRKPGSWSSRAILNEQELVEAMQQRWPTANVSLLHFESLPSKSEAMLAVRRTNVFIGVHGAGKHWNLGLMCLRDSISRIWTFFMASCTCKARLLAARVIFMPS